MNIILLGPPGAGKGTQAAVISARYKLAHISTGDIFRAAVASGSELGARAKACMERGELVPDAVTIAIVRERLTGTENYILDGFPRTTEQAEALDSFAKIDAAVNISVPAEYLIDRAIGRRICKKCGATYHIKYNAPQSEGICDKCGGELYQRADDNAETMSKRLSNYEKSTRPLIEYYRKRGKLIEIDGRKPIGEVSGEILAKLEEVRA